MSRQTIEQLMKPVILGDIQSLLIQQAEANRHTLRLCNDFSFAVETDTRKTIAAVIQTGKPTRSDQGVHAVRQALTLMFRVDVNYLQMFLRILNAYCVATQNYKASVTDDVADESATLSIDYEYRLFWDGPITTGTKYTVQVAVLGDPNVKSEPISTTLVVLTGAIIFSKDLSLDEDQVYLQVNVDEDGLYDATGTPTYVRLKGIGEDLCDITAAVDPTGLVEEYKPVVSISGDTQSFSYTMVRIADDPVHDYLMKMYYIVRTNQTLKASMRFSNTLIDATIDSDVIIANIKKFLRGGFMYLSIAGVFV